MAVNDLFEFPTVSSLSQKHETETAVFLSLNFAPAPNIFTGLHNLTTALEQSWVINIPPWNRYFQHK